MKNTAKTILNLKIRAGRKAKNMVDIVKVLFWPFFILGLFAFVQFGACKAKHPKWTLSRCSKPGWWSGK